MVLTATWLDSFTGWVNRIDDLVWGTSFISVIFRFPW